MAKFGFKYEVDVEATEKQGGGGGVLPHMYARIWAEAIDIPETKDKKGHQAAITFEVQEPEEFKGRKFWAYWTAVHQDGFQNKAYKYGKPMLDRFARAVDVNLNEDTDLDDLLFKSFVVEIGIQEGGAKPEGGFYNDKNQIEHFYYSDANAKEPTPEVGIIGDGEAKKSAPKSAPVAANNNKPAAAEAPAKGKTPWGAKKAA